MSAFERLRQYVLLLAIASQCHVLLAVSCSSPYYCLTSEIKYISMEQLPNVYLNATAIKTYTVENVSQCQQFCILEKRCQSINLNMSKINHFDCILLDVNKYSNSSLLVTDNQLSHLYIPSKCSSHPCDYEGVCVPLHHNDSFKCECKQSSLSLTRGKRCETLLTGYDTAFIYWSFDNKSTSIPSTSSNMDMSSYSISWKSASEPGRSSHVLMCVPGDTHCTEIHNNLPCINTFSTCALTVTYSFWLKQLKSDIGTSSNIFRPRYTGSRTGIRMDNLSSAGFLTTITVSKYKRWVFSPCGMEVSKTKWNHFTFTVDDNKMSCVFINGVKEQCVTSPTSVNVAMYNNNRFLIGRAFDSNKKTNMFLDDFGIWLTVLNDDEVFSLYAQSRT